MELYQNCPSSHSNVSLEILLNFVPFGKASKEQHTNCIDKFNCLKSILDENAAIAIQGLPLTEGNYEAAVKILQERFGKKQQIISAHMEELLKLQTCPNDKASQIRYVYN